jgi:hypothetical protein
VRKSILDRIAAALLLGLLAGSLYLAGCGEEPPQTDREKIEVLVDEFLDDIAGGDAEAACEKQGKSSPPSTKSTCLKELRRWRDHPTLALVYSNGSLRISKVTVTDRRATVLLVNGALSNPVYLQKKRAGWKITSWALPIRD